MKLEYIDDSGRLLSAKEAFRYLSHKFHGKGPGKNKVDKRMKKLEQDTVCYAIFLHFFVNNTERVFVIYQINYSTATLFFCLIQQFIQKSR